MNSPIENCTYSNIELVHWILENHGVYKLRDGYPIMIGARYYAMMDLVDDAATEEVADKPARKARTPKAV